MRGGNTTKSIASTPGVSVERLQHQEDRGVGVIEADRPDRVEALEVVLVRRMIAVPGHDVERRVVDRGPPQVACELRDELEVALPVLVPRDGRPEVAGIGEPVAADRPQVRKAERRAVVLADIPARIAVGKLDREAHAARDHGNLGRRDLEPAELGAKPQPALLRHDQKLAVGVVEIAVAHRPVRRVQVDAAALHRDGASVAAHRDPAVDEVDRRRGKRQRVPAQLVRRRRGGLDVLAMRPLSQRSKGRCTAAGRSR